MTRLSDSKAILKDIKRLAMIMESMSDTNLRDSIFDNDDYDSFNHLIKDGIKTAKRCLRALDYLSHQIILRKPEILDKRYMASNTKIELICKLNEEISHISLLEYVSSKHESSYRDLTDPHVALHLIRDTHNINSTDEIKMFLTGIKESSERLHRFNNLKDTIANHLFRLEMQETYVRSIQKNKTPESMSHNIVENIDHIEDGLQPSPI